MGICICNYTRRQWGIFLILAIANFAMPGCGSILAPFYPKVAEEKGVTPSQYGFVFGIYPLVMFLVSPFCGKYMNKIGPKFMINVGMFISGSTIVLFGFLDDVNDKNDFIILSFAIRIVAAMFGDGFTCARNAIVSAEFPDNVGTIFATLETFFGMGLFAGPAIGGALYEIGGYRLPFAVLGVVLLIVTAVSMLILPKDPLLEKNDEETAKKNPQPSMIEALEVPAISFYVISVISE